MNRIKPLSASFTLLLLVVALAGFEGCASMDASNTESLLSAAGFRTRTPSTPKRQALYSQLAPYKLERRTKNGKVLYTYAGKQKGSYSSAARLSINSTSVWLCNSHLSTTIQKI